MDAVTGPDPRTQHQPSQDPRSKRKELAAQGFAWELYEAIRREPSDRMDWDIEFDALYAALQQRVRSNTDKFSEELFGHLLATGTYFVLRAEFLVGHTLKSVDKRSRRGQPYLPGTLVERHLPQLFDLYKSVAEIASLRASTLRQLELTRAKRSENGGPAREATDGPTRPAKPNGSPRVPGSNGKPPGTNGNGHVKKPNHGPINRLKGRQNGSHDTP